jgi:hypothetical protein
LAYEGSLNKVPTEYWEYRLVEDHFRGDWFLYWKMPEHLIEMIVGFRRAENEAARLQEKRWRRDYGRPNIRTADSNRGN